MPRAKSGARVTRCARCMLAVWVGLVCSGCRDPDLEAFDSVVDQTPGIYLPPAKLELQAAVPGQTVRYDDVIVVLPRGWSVESTRETEEGVWEVRLRIAVNGKSVEAKLQLQEPYTWITDPPEELMLKRARRWVSDPAPFLKQYKSDLEFFRAVWNVTPDDRRKARGDARQWARFLLDLKRSLCVTKGYVATPALSALLIYRKRRNYVTAFLFDKAGKKQAIALFEIPGETRSEREGLLLQKILANSRFASGGEKVKPPGNRQTLE